MKGGYVGGEVSLKEGYPYARFYQCVIILTSGVYLYYLVYRLLYTINTDALVFSLLFYYAELHGFVALSLYFFQIWHPIKRKAPPPPDGLTVDVFIPTYNEDPLLLRKTVIACMEMNYPNRTYILDDGDRTEVARMAEELGCGYIARKERVDAKAGNLNHALTCTDGEFIVVFDADFVPEPDFLDKLLGYFLNEKVAFVQTPHSYYNVDTFQFKLNLKKKKSWNEQDVFYRLIMPGRDYWDSVFFAGTCAVFRRKALEDIGGFATGTITEDLHTTIELYRRGWKGVYHNEILAHGLGAKDIRSYHTQKLRWAEGNVSLIFKDNPLFVKGLSPAQRICFFATIFGWFIGFPKLIYFITPPIMLLTGMYPIVPFDMPFIWRYLLFLTVIILGFKIASQGYGRVRYDETYNMMNFFILMKAVIRNIVRTGSEFVVTSKGLRRLPGLQDITPQMVVMVLCFSGVWWGLFKLLYGISADIKGIGIAGFWALVNGILAVAVIKDVTQPHHKRTEFRFIGAVPVGYSVREEGTRHEGLGISRDLNENGVSLITFAPLPLTESLELKLHLGMESLSLRGTVVYLKELPLPSHPHHEARMFNYGIRFYGMEQKHRDIINRFCFNSILPVFFHRFENRQSFFMKMAFWYYNRKWLQKRSVRSSINLPVVIRVNPVILAVTHDISASGLAFVSHTQIRCGRLVAISIITPYGEMVLDGEVKRTKAIGPGGPFFVGVRFVNVPEGIRSILVDMTGKNHQGLKRWIS